MNKIIGLFVVMFSSVVFAEDIQLIAKINDQQGKPHKNKTIESFHSINIRNTGINRHDYKYIRCITFVNHHSCLGKVIKLNPGEKFNDHDSSAKMIINPSSGIYKISASTQVDYKKSEDFATLIIN